VLLSIADAALKARDRPEAQVVWEDEAKSWQSAIVVHDASIFERHKTVFL